MSRLTARDIMTTDVVTLSESTTARDVARLFAEHRISGAPVVDDDGRLLGIVTEDDLLLKEAAAGDLPPRLSLFWLMFRSKSVEDRLRRYEGATAGDLMTSKVLTVSEDTTVHRLAWTMARDKINRVPVVRDGKVIGIVTRNDVLKVYLRTDDTLVADLREALQPYAPHFDDVEIDCHDSVVSVSGKVDRRSDVRLFERLAHSVDGVVAVDTEALAFHRDDLSW